MTALSTFCPGRDQWHRVRFLNVMELVWPSAAYLPGYREALERGWTPDNLNPKSGRRELALIESDPELFLSRQVDREAKGPPIVLPDGSEISRLPGYNRWIEDDGFCGSINFRWQPGTSDLPPLCLGHIGYSIVPWRRRRGYATEALRMLLAETDEEGLTYVELTTDASNVASQRVIEANGGLVVERFDKPAVYGGTPSVRYRIMLSGRR